MPMMHFIYFHFNSRPMYRPPSQPIEILYIFCSNFIRCLSEVPTVFLTPKSLTTRENMNGKVACFHRDRVQATGGIHTCQGSWLDYRW